MSIYGEVPAASVSPHCTQLEEQENICSVLIFIWFLYLKHISISHITVMTDCDSALEAKIHMYLLHFSEKVGERLFSGVKFQQEPKLLRALSNMQQFTLEKS